jgi:hypothetical protein
MFRRIICHRLVNFLYLQGMDAGTCSTAPYCRYGILSQT